MKCLQMGREAAKLIASRLLFSLSTQARDESEMVGFSLPQWTNPEVTGNISKENTEISKTGQGCNKLQLHWLSLMRKKYI